MYTYQPQDKLIDLVSFYGCKMISSKSYQELADIYKPIIDINVNLWLYDRFVSQLC